LNIRIPPYYKFAVYTSFILNEKRRCVKELNVGVLTRICRALKCDFGDIMEMIHREDNESQEEHSGARVHKKDRPRRAARRVLQICVTAVRKRANPRSQPVLAHLSPAVSNLL
jgi:hypothetical protein